MLLSNDILQRYFYDVAINTFRFVNAQLTASNKDELHLANQNIVYKIIAIKNNYLHFSKQFLNHTLILV